MATACSKLSRKFILSIGFGVVAGAALFLGKIESSQFVYLALGTIGLYGTSNIAEYIFKK